MAGLVEVRVPLYPDCWESCGSCAAGEVEVTEVLVRPGDVVRRDDTLIVIETGKTTLEIPSTHDGRVVAVAMAPGTKPAEGDLIVTLEALD
jgi:pyruvate/2-oxoglutarate dehydrogenase complex dihydrolipoamide acyltransferase (E2) component